VEPAWKIKAQKAAALVLEYYGLENWGGAIQIFSNIHVGWGLGSSTSDVTATIRAVSDAFNKKPDPTEIAILAVKAERASDSIMFNGNAVLFASREGFVVEGLAGAVPVLEVLGFNTDPTGVGIDTLNFSPAHYSWWEIEAFRPLLGLLRRAVHTQDVRLVGQVASASALINQRFLPKPHFEELNAVVKETGSVGLQVAHSGTTVGLLFDPNDPATPVGIRKAEKLIARMGLTETWRFQTRAS
jgi:uncharacterized protein involved in propanediol utilization